MKAIRLPKCSVMVNADFYVSNTNNVIKRNQDDEAFHEHDFISIAVKQLNSHLIIRCITCDKYYCETCGKALTDGEIQYLLSK
jgi:hypothetical protein